MQSLDEDCEKKKYFVLNIECVNTLKHSVSGAATLTQNSQLLN